MKKTVLFILLSAFALTGFAQEHLEFQNIPIDGNVDSFAQKIMAKGWKYDAAQSANLSDYYAKGYVGRYFGRDATLSVLFSQNTKTVYSTQVIFHLDNIASLKFLATDISAALVDKFHNCDTTSVIDKDGYPNFIILVKDTKTSGGLGLITVKQKIDPFLPSLVVSFGDTKNMNKYLEERKSDL